MDHIGTQFGPPAHENDHGATISDIPPTVALRPLVVINVAPKVAMDPGYQATVGDIKDWEHRHGPIPAGSVVMIRSDWSKKWNDPKRFTAQPFPGVSLAALKYLHLDRHILMHGHEPLDTDNTAPEFVGEKWLLQHNFAQAEGVANLDQVPEAGALITIGFAKFEGGQRWIRALCRHRTRELAVRRDASRISRVRRCRRTLMRCGEAPMACCGKRHEQHQVSAAHRQSQGLLLRGQGRETLSVVRLRTLQVPAILRWFPRGNGIPAGCLQGGARRGRHFLRLQANRHRTLLRWGPQQPARRLSHG